MIRKLLSQFVALFSSKPVLVTSPEIQSLADKKWNNPDLTSGVAEKLDKFESKPVAQINLDTGKITLPDNMTESEKAEVEAAMKELQQSFQQLNKDQFQSLEDFLSQNTKTGQSFTIPFTTANGLNDAQVQVFEEMENCKEDTEHWSDEDFLEALLGYYNGGYRFDGIEEMHNKLNSRQDLGEEDKRKLRHWYILATQELVYDV